MNSASKQRVTWVEELAVVYTSHTDLQAIILGGSTARGVAHEQSDIDLGLFWREVASRKERNELIRMVEGCLDRQVENQERYNAGNPRRQGCLEIITIQPTADRPGFRLDLEHETIAGTDQVISQVIDDYDPSLEKQELLSVIADGIVLYGHEVVECWREKTKQYPDELVEKMVRLHLLGTSEFLLRQARWVSSQDWFCLYEGFLEIGRRLLLALMGLNRVWAFTDNPDFKGLKPFTDGLAWQPENFVDRLGQLLQSNTNTCIDGLAGLIEETLRLVNLYVPTIDTSDELEKLELVRHKG